jgi:outer membrane immunogenic protein
MGCIAAGALNASAHAADFPIKTMPMPDAVPVWSWTGFYIGGNGGGGWGTTETSLTSLSAPVIGTVPLGIPVAQNNRSGFLGGGQIGYNYQTGWLVIGVGADIDALNVKGTTPCVIVFSCTSSSNWLATASARVGGVVGERTLVYVKGGGAWMNTQQSAALASGIAGGLGALGAGGVLGGGTLSASSTSSGALLGLGAEYMFSQHWTGFIEYDYMEFGTKNLTFPIAVVPGAVLNASTTNKLSTAKIGLNYKF